MGGNWAGACGMDDDALPQTLQVDWVKDYEFNNSTMIELAPHNLCTGYTSCANTCPHHAIIMQAQIIRQMLKL